MVILTNGGHFRFGEQGTFSLWYHKVHFLNAYLHIHWIIDAIGMSRSGCHDGRVREELIGILP
jgi:hypothetical protein